MTQIGEAVAPPDFGVSDTHSESTCPWHQKGEPKKQKMAATNPDDDAMAMPPNDGGELGKNMRAIDNVPPSADSVELAYAQGAVFEYEVGKKKELKSVRLYNPDTHGKMYEYKLQYAPHHLIPGNESLKGTELVAFLGDDDTIAEFAEGGPSHIKEGYSTGYDVNRGKNGAWLPSPYALSMKNDWPAQPSVKVVKKRKLIGGAAGSALAKAQEDFKQAYVAASIEDSGGRQFHMRHKKYSDKVKEMLGAIADRMSLMAGGECPLAAPKEGSDKIDPPYGVVGRLDVLSANLDRFLTGSLWRPPLYTDEMTREYAEDIVRLKQQGKAVADRGQIDTVV